MLKTKLPESLYITQRGNKKEVHGPHFTGPAIAETFTVDEAAAALHRTTQTLRRWIDREIVPAPVLQCGVSRVLYYSKGELEIMARELARHSEEYQNVCEKHSHVKEGMHQRMHAFRTHHV